MYVDLDTGTIVGNNLVYIPEISEDEFIDDLSDSEIIERALRVGWAIRAYRAQVARVEKLAGQWERLAETAINPDSREWLQACSKTLRECLSGTEL